MIGITAVFMVWDCVMTPRHEAGVLGSGASREVQRSWRFLASSPPSSGGVLLWRRTLICQ